jgi:MFS family permease
VALLSFAFQEQIEKKPHKLDIAGVVLIAVAVVALLVGSRGGPQAFVGIAVAIAAIVGFIAVERRAAEPLLPIELFSRRVMAVTTALGALIGGAMIATVTFVPLYVQAVLGGSATDAGSAITPMVIGWPIFSAISGRILPRVGFRPLVWTGLALSSLGALGLALFLSPSMSLAVPRLTTALFGAGLGCANTALIIAVQTSVPWEQRGVATASTMFFRTIGGTLTVGLLGGMLARELAKDPRLPAEAANALLGPTHGRSLPPEVLEGLSGVLASTMGALFWVIALIAGTSFVVSWLFPYVPTHSAQGGRRPAVGAVS